MRTAWTLAGERQLTARARVSWDREWLDQDVRQRARFAAQPDVVLDSVNTLVPRDTLGLRAGLDWQHSDRVTVGLALGAQLGGGYRAVDGQLNVRWVY